MIKQHHQVFNFFRGVGDLLTIAAAWWAAYVLRFALWQAPKGVVPWQSVALHLALTLLLAVIVMAGSGLYRPQRDQRFLLELGAILKAGTLVWGVLVVVLYFVHQTPFTRGMLMLFWPLVIAALTIERGLLRVVLRFVRRRGWNLRHAVIVGTGRLGQTTLHKLAANSWTGIHVRGFIDTHVPSARRSVHGVKVLGTVEQIRQIVQDEAIDSVFVAISARHGERLAQVIAQLEQTSADVRIVPDLYLTRFRTNMAVGELDGLPILSLREDPLAGWPGVYKRAFDLLGAAFGLLLLGSLLMAPIALAIWWTSGRPIIYRQRRVSLGGKAFDIYKFRTMVPDAEAVHGPVFATADDPRCTRLGRLLRSTSLDELPQLFNVLRGDMSLVGPRPERPEMLERIQRELPTFPLRLKVRPGLTGWAQVHGFRGRTSFRKRLQYDLYYLNNWSPLLDVRIVLATMVRGFRHPSAH